MPRQLPQPSFGVLKFTKGGSAVEQAAYNARESLHDVRFDKTYDEQLGREDLIAKGIMAADFTQPDNQAQDWVFDRETLWNKAQNCENVNGQPARTGMLPIPRGLSDEQSLEFLQDYLQETFVDHGVVVDWALHRVESSDGHPSGNLHAHILCSMRELEGGTFSRTKNRDWNKKSTLKYWRENYEKKANEHLDQAGSEERITIQSYQAQGLNKLPGIHLGERAWTLEKQGISTKQGHYNARVAHHNQIRQAVDGLSLASPQSALAPGQTAPSQQAPERPILPAPRPALTATSAAPFSGRAPGRQGITGRHPAPANQAVPGTFGNRCPKEKRCYTASTRGKRSRPVISALYWQG